MTHVYANGWTDRGSGYKDGLFRSSGEHEKSISLYFTHYRLLRAGCTVNGRPVGVPAPPGVFLLFLPVYRLDSANTLCSGSIAGSRFVDANALIDAPVDRQPSSQRFRRRGDWTFRS